jgi:hypothetical protein
MKRGNVIITVIVFVFLGLSTNAQITFQKTYGGTQGDDGRSVHQTIDSGYIIVGGTSSFGPGYQNIYVIKANVYGDIVWTNNYGLAPYGSYASSVIQTKDSGYMIGGYLGTIDDSTYGFCLIRLNSLGDSLWTKTYLNDISNIGLSIQQTNDGGFIITGYSGVSTNTSTFKTYLIKTNSLGDTLWTRIFEGMNGGYSVLQTNDKGYFIAGYTNHFGAGGYDAYLIKIDSLGNNLWSKTYGGPNYDNAYTVQQTTDNGYIIIGSTSSFGSGGYDIYLIKTDSLGDTLWTRSYGGAGDDAGEYVQQTNDKGYILIGSTNSFGAGGYDVYLIKTDSLGDTLWTRTYGGSLDDYGYSVEQTNDHGYIITGSTRSFGEQFGNVYLIKTDSLGNSGCNQGNTATIFGPTSTQITIAPVQISYGGSLTYPPISVSNGGSSTTICFSSGITEIPFDNMSISIYPNPFNLSTTLYINGETNQNDYSLYIYNLLGQEVGSIYAGNKKEIVISREDLASGMYFYKLIDNKGSIVTGKLMIEE